MELGVSTACLYPEFTEKAVKYLCENGVKNIEIFFNAPCELGEEILSEIKSITRLNGTRVMSIHPFTSSFEPFMLFSDYERRFDDSLELSKVFFDAANELGAEIVVLHGDRADRDNQDERYFERYKKLYDLGRKNGVYVAQENVSRCRSRDVDFIRNMRKSLNNDVKFVLDFKQARRSKITYKEVSDAMGESLLYIHINDFDSKNDCLLPGQGNCDFKEAFSYLENNGFKGNGVIEVYRENYKEYSELKYSLNYLKTLYNSSDFC